MSAVHACNKGLVTYFCHTIILDSKKSCEVNDQTTDEGDQGGSSVVLLGKRKAVKPSWSKEYTWNSEDECHTDKGIGPTHRPSVSPVQRMENHYEK